MRGRYIYTICLVFASLHHRHHHHCFSIRVYIPILFLSVSLALCCWLLTRLAPSPQVGPLPFPLLPPSPFAIFNSGLQEPSLFFVALSSSRLLDTSTRHIGSIPPDHSGIFDKNAGRDCCSHPRRQTPAVSGADTGALPVHMCTTWQPSQPPG